MTLKLAYSQPDAPEETPMQQWWGYMRGDGETILRRYCGAEQIECLTKALGVKHVRGPFMARDKRAAYEKLHHKLQRASLAAQQRREQEGKPCPDTSSTSSSPSTFLVAQ